MEDFQDSIAENMEISRHPRSKHLLAVLEDRTYAMPSGFPIISETAFIRFIRMVPHLFRNGHNILEWLGELKPFITEIEDGEQKLSMLRACKVMRNMVNTASITAPPDLWLMRQILSEYKRRGILDWLLEDEMLDPDRYAIKHGLNSRQLKIDCHFLYSRGYLSYEAPCFMAPVDPELRSSLKNVTVLPEDFQTDWCAHWVKWFSEDQSNEALEKRLRQWLKWSGHHERSRISWVPSLNEIDLGYRLLPVILAMRAANLSQKINTGDRIAEKVPRLFYGLRHLFEETGLVEDGLVTRLGERVFKRGPGPFGIIGAYFPYLNKHRELLSATGSGIWVSRGENVAASQDANKKTFKAANQALDDFCRDTGFKFKVFIEHAVGKGEATRQRMKISGSENIRYFGADLEDEAIDAAVAEQHRGVLPKNMEFIRNADIGKPEKIIERLKEEGIPSSGAVMIVGNGFHEVRDQTNEKMLEVFKDYCKAGILILFTEETGLTDVDLRATAWNTYHAGFRHVHEMSGQGLRPSWDSHYLKNIWSWRRCAEEAGYDVLDQYTRGARPIYPIEKKGRENPTISVTYFCVPRELAAKLDIPGQA